LLLEPPTVDTLAIKAPIAAGLESRDPLSLEQKLAELFAQEHVAVIVTQGEEWPTATLQAFAEIPELDLLFIMGDTAREVPKICSGARKGP